MNFQQALNLNQAEHYPINACLADRNFDINPHNLTYQSSRGHLDPNKSRFKGTDHPQSLGQLPLQGHQGRAFQNHDLAKSRSMASEPTAFDADQRQCQLVNQQNYVPNLPPEGEMSQSYLQMKQTQETRTLMERADSNVVAMEHLKRNQALELQKNLELQQQNVRIDRQAPRGRSEILVSQGQYATIPKLVPDRHYCAFNAQGEAVSDPTSLHQDTPNKYKELKYMSPEMLNQRYGRPSDQSVAPICHEPQGDIYQLTSYTGQPASSPPPSSNLRQLMAQSHQAIMTQKTPLGIQSYHSDREGGYGTSLDQAYQPPTGDFKGL